MAGGDPKTAVQLVEENWERSEYILSKAAGFFTLNKNLDVFKNIFNHMNKYDREETIRENIRNISYFNIEEISELMKDLSLYTKDIVLISLAEKYAIIGKFEDALDTASKTVQKTTYIHALNDIFLTLMEKFSRE
jgi:hypothetical protein